MWRRHEKDQSDVRASEPDPQLDDEALAAWERWHERWDRPEEERVALWLRTKGVQAIVQESEPSMSDRPDYGYVRRVDHEEQQQQRSGAEADWVAAVDLVNGEVATVDAPRHELAPKLDVERSEVERQKRELAAELEAERADVERQKHELLAGLEAERSAIHEERRRLVSGFQAAQFESQEAERRWRETSAALEADVADLQAEVSALETRRREIIANMETAVAAAEQAHLAEAAALTRLEAVQEHAKKVEAEQFEIWEALEAEVAALRRQLGGPSSDDVRDD